VRALHVASEVAPFAQSGGLADVVAGLPNALAELGEQCAVLVPLYRGVAQKLALTDAGPIEVVVGKTTFRGGLKAARVGRVAYGFLDLPALYDREGSLYGPRETSEFGDNHLRFGALGAAALTCGERLLGGVDLLHVHDWQGGAAAIYARLARPALRIVATIHNLAFRGVFGKFVMDELGLPWSLFTTRGIEFYDQVSLLKGGIAVSDATTTVSPSYAREILTPARGEALDEFLRWDVARLVGIVNGIDVTAWDPATDPALPANFSREVLGARMQNRTALCAEMQLAPKDGEPLIGAIARMSDQKGLDLIADLVSDLARIGARMIVLGSGEPDLEARFRWLGEVYRDHLAVRIGFDHAMSRRIYGGLDFFAMPSRFEPCGLGQLYAMRYGVVPIVHAVGGLRDTVIDPGDGDLARGLGTGIRFDAPNAGALRGALERAVRLYRDPVAFATLRRAAMARDSSWAASARQYLELYRSLAELSG